MPPPFDDPRPERIRAPTPSAGATEKSVTGTVKIPANLRPAGHGDPDQHPRLEGAHTPGPAPIRDQCPTRVQRTVSCRGDTQIIGQRLKVALRYAGQIVTIEESTKTTLRIDDHAST
jgi:hypothetical protein